MPVNAAGWRIEPPVSVPVAAGARRAATAAAEPPELPPGTRPGPTDCAPGRSTSSRSTSPSRTRPCWSCRGCTAPARVELLDHVRVVGRDEVGEHLRAARGAPALAQKMSLCAIGMPVSGAASPCAMRASAARACARRLLRVDGDERVAASPFSALDALEEDARVELDARESRLRARAQPRPSFASGSCAMHASTRSPAAPGTGRPRPRARSPGSARAGRVSVTASSRRRCIARPARATSARRPSVSTACICVDHARRCRSAVAASRQPRRRRQLEAARCAMRRIWSRESMRKCR